MKVKNMNNSSVKTRKLIKDTFIAMLAEKREVSDITVSKLAERANISRATFYSHFDDIYDVVEEFESEIIEEFFTDAKLLATDNYEKFFDELLSFMEKNDKNYKIMCRTNDFLFSAKNLAAIAIGKLFEITNEDCRIKNRDFIELEISIFMEGIFCEYIKYCRGLTAFTPKILCEYSKAYYKRFIDMRCV